MKFTPKKFCLFITIIFSALFCWTVLSSKGTAPPLMGHHSTTSKLPDDEDGNANKIVNNVESPVRDDQYNDAYTPGEIENKPSKTSKPRKQKKTRQKDQIRLTDYANIPCSINDQYKIDCLQNQINSSVYIPFTFIKKYFEINGKIVNNTKGKEYFDWNHSYSKVFFPDQPYSHSDKYLWFENFNVELRERVLCVSASNGVPITTQWFSKGHFYPTQIAQYGLSHFNKNITEPSAKSILLFQNSKYTNKVRIESSNGKEDVSIFETTLEQPLTLILNKFALAHLVADFELWPLGHFNMTFHFSDVSEETPLQYSLTYSTLIDTPLIKTSSFILSSVSDDSISRSSPVSPEHGSVYGLTSSILNQSSFRFTRDLLVDLIKSGLSSARKRSNFTVTRVTFSGNVKVHSLALLTSAHARFAEIAGEWFLKNQNELGGWDIKVRRKLQKNKSGILILEPGWHSAMAQGQAISLLIRLYQRTKDHRYIEAAKNGLKLFEKEAIERGVRARLFDKFVWYEEYPTTPSIFVLNGFIYSLFGLYDLGKACDDPECQKAEAFFSEGVKSLEETLLLFDSGSGSFYDLRHLSLSGPPNVARWDYHSTHINQLLQLNTLVKRDLFENTIERWTQYMKGYRAPHN